MIVITTDMSGFVATKHSGLCEQYVHSPAYMLEIQTFCYHEPKCIVTPELV